MFDFPASPVVGQSYSPSSGVTYQWDGQAWVNSGLLATASMIERIYAGTQTTVWNKPAGLAYLEVEGVAAGASAGASAAAGAGTWGFASGGGGGAWGKKLFKAEDLPSSVTITIGAPGAAAVNSSGVNGNNAADTTFGSLITLPGGLKGFLGTNAAYASWNTVSGSGFTAAPTGVDVGSPGESSDFPVVGVAVGTSPGTVLCYNGRAGSSPWGKAFPPMWAGAAGLSSSAGSGYGWGSTAGISSGGQASKSSVAGGQGCVRVREFYVQPSGVMSGIVTPWVAYTPTFTGFGTPTSVGFFSRRVGGSLQIRGRFAAGTPTATEARITLGYNGVSGNVLGDPVQLPAQCLVGVAAQSTVGTNIYYVLAEPSLSYLTFSVQNAARNALTKLIGTDAAASGQVWSFNAEVPIQGWG
jgi:hypothetical protein